MKFNLKSLILGSFASLLASSAVADDTKLLVWGDPVREPIYQAFADAKGIEVEMVSVSNQELIAKLQLALRSGEGIPDAIFMADVNFAAQLSTRRVNYLMELSDKVDASLVEGFYPTSLAPCEKANGSLICLRNDVAHFMLWYNAPLMKELGLNVPTTWEEFEAVAASAAGNNSGIVSGAAAQHIPLMNFLMSHGCNVAIPMADDPETLKINATAPQCVEAAQMVDRMLENGSLSRTGVFDPEFIELAKSDKLLMILGPTWFGEYIIKNRFEFAEGTTGVAYPPRREAEAQPLAWSWGGGVWGGWKDTKHPELVVELLEFATTNKDVTEKAVTMPAHQPASVPWGEALMGTGYYASDDAFEQMLKAASFGHPGYASLRIDSRASFNKALVNDLANGATLESLLPQLQEEFVNAAKLARYKIVVE